jgi:DNA phosphorothioation-dependent restriction protein DptG
MITNDENKDLIIRRLNDVITGLKRNSGSMVASKDREVKRISLENKKLQDKMGKIVLSVKTDLSKAISQQKLPFLQKETPETLQDRVKTIQQVLNNILKVVSSNF